MTRASSCLAGEQAAVVGWLPGHAGHPACDGGPQFSLVKVHCYRLRFASDPAATPQVFVAARPPTVRKSPP